jgi:hypothetical protein
MSDETQQLSAIDGGPIRETADVPRQVFGFARMIGRVIKQGSFKPLHDYVLVPAKLPTDYALEPLADLAAQLATRDAQVAKAVLDEAQAIYREPQDRIDSAERRATTLQGAVAISASVVVAGAGLLLDPAKFPGQEWRVAFAAVLLAFVICLTACAIRALGVTGRVFRFHEPGPQRVGKRASMSENDALVHRAAELLRSAEVANQVARVKVGLLRSAAWWFRIAILALAALAGLMLAYAIAAPRAAENPSGRTAKPATTSSTQKPAVSVTATAQPIRPRGR